MGWTLDDITILGISGQTDPGRERSALGTA